VAGRVAIGAFDMDRTCQSMKPVQVSAPSGRFLAPLPGFRPEYGAMWDKAQVAG
jgi:hypothetical protein